MEPLHATDVPTLEGVTPTTSALLAWWFGPHRAHARAQVNLDGVQRQAILATIAAHETGGAPHRRHCLELATGSGRTPVLLALLIWQLVNRMHAQASGCDDPRFARHFLVVAPGLIAYERLLDAFCGHPIPGGLGARDFGAADLVRFSDFYLPPAWRDRVIAFVCGSVCDHNDIGLKATGDGLLALAHRRLLVEGRARSPSLQHLGQLSELMVFDDEAHPIPGLVRAGCTTDVAWQACLHRIASGKGSRYAQVNFLDTPPQP